LEVPTKRKVQRSRWSCDPKEEEGGGGGGGPVSCERNRRVQLAGCRSLIVVIVGVVVAAPFIHPVPLFR